MAYPKNQIFAFYTLLTASLTFIGYWNGKKSNQANEKAWNSFVAGILISTILWQVWGKSNSY